MDILKAKDYFNLGVIKAATVHAPCVMHPKGWAIYFDAKLVDSTLVFKTMRGEVRQFKTLDAAAKVLAEIGFKRWSVEL